MESKIDSLEWSAVRKELSANGYAHVKNVLDGQDCTELIRLYEKEELFRKTVVMERYRFGLGEYKHFAYSLPLPLQSLREALYGQLVSVANGWDEQLGSKAGYPSDYGEWLERCKLAGQSQPTVLMLKYGVGGHNTLHQDLYGEIYFPIQALFVLSEEGMDYEGGEFVLVQQTPRAQSRAIVLRPRSGDLVLFATNARPVKGRLGYYRANMKHGVSEVRAGERYALGIIFHDAAS